MNDEHAKQIQEAITLICELRRDARGKIHSAAHEIEAAQVAFTALHLALVQLETLMEVIGERQAP
jgi:hypothetical protein